MKSTLSIKKRWKSVFILIALTVFAFYITHGVLIWLNLLQGEHRDDIALEDAQKLVSFRICMPSYIPTGINPAPIINFDISEANTPEETYIRMLYGHEDDNKVLIEVIQNYTPDNTMTTNISKAGIDGAKVTLLDWMFPLRFFSESRLDTAKNQTKVIADHSQFGDTVWWIYEIDYPTEYHSTMTKWITNHVQYRVLSYLSADELRKVTLSMLECSNN